MGRHAQGWKLQRRPDSANYYVYFHHQGKRHIESTGKRNPAAAQATAARIYTEIVSGKRQKRQPRKRVVAEAPLDLLFAKWLASLETELSRETAVNYAMYVTAHFLPFFTALERVTSAECSNYVRARLRHVQRKTVLKELSALRRFIAWCAEQNYLAENEVPVVKSPPVRSTGTPDNARRKVGGWVHLTAQEADAIIAQLPELSRHKRPARAYYRVLWETGLRPQTVCSIRAPDDYFRGATVLRIRSEADKSRWGRDVPLTAQAIEALNAVCPKQGYLFPRMPSGNPACYRMLLRRAAREAGLSEARAARISDYDFRHGRTTQLVEETGNILGAGFLVGHRNATTTNVYLHARSNMAKAVLDTVAEKNRAMRGPTIP